MYKHFGRGIVAAAMGADEGSADVEAVYLAVYRTFMEAIDAIDNGARSGGGRGLLAEAGAQRRSWQLAALYTRSRSRPRSCS